LPFGRVCSNESILHFLEIHCPHGESEFFLLSNAIEFAAQNRRFE